MCDVSAETPSSEKILVTELGIVVRVIDGKPYYEIKYKKVGHSDYNVGYSSYNLDFVLEWRDNYFIIVGEDSMKAVAQFYRVSLSQWLKDCTAPSANERYANVALPVRKTVGSAGYDFLAPCDIIIQPHDTILIQTGIKCQIDEGYVLELYPRSSLGYKYRLTLDNTVGIIDSDYYNNESNEGHISCKMTNNSDKVLYIKKGEGYMQGLFKQFFITKDDNASAVRVGGIGSTNKQN